MQVSYAERPTLVPVPRGTKAPWLSRGANKMKLDAPFFVTVEDRTYVVPRGFITDGFSIPRLFWWAFPPSYSPGYSAAIFHDWCYALGAESGFTKAEADAAFRALMEFDGASPKVAWMFWLGVRANVFGGAW